MRILILHNRYKFAGGEEAVVYSEAELLRQHGHYVRLFELSNESLDKFSFLRKLMLPARSIWSYQAYRQTRSIIREEKIDIAHVHNTFFLLSPSVYYACRRENVPVIQTLHNYRFLCPLATLYRDGKVCRECLDQGLGMSIKYKCGSKPMVWTLTMLCVLKLHYMNNTFKKMIDTYIALSNFTKEQFMQAGFDAGKIKVKPNFISFDPGFSSEKEDFALCVGRFSPEKGIDLLIEAWKKIDFLPLKIIGSGDDYRRLKQYAEKNSLKIEFLGQRTNNEVIDCIKRSLFVILPSRCNENFPRIIVESFACGVPVIASNRGALAEIVENNKTGLLFDPENTDDLAGKVSLLFRNRELIKVMSNNARREFENKYTAERNYEMLISIYKDTINRFN